MLRNIGYGVILVSLVALSIANYFPMFAAIWYNTKEFWSWVF